MKSKIILFISLVFLLSCSKPKVRKPVIHNSKTSYFDESIAVNKAIINQEELEFKQVIANDTINHYIASPFGFWYYYNSKKSTNNIKVKSGNQVIISYEIRNLNNELILDKNALGSLDQKLKEDRVLRVDGEDFLLGLHHGIKLMREGEEVTFLMPSNLAFGATGLTGKIAPNQPLIIKVKLKKIIN